MSNALFICENCGGVAPDTCPDCGEDAKGVTVQTIKDHINAVPDHPSVQEVRRHYGKHIATLTKKGGEAGVMAIQIHNLVDYRFAQFRED